MSTVPIDADRVGGRTTRGLETFANRVRNGHPNAVFVCHDKRHAENCWRLARKHGLAPPIRQAQIITVHDVCSGYLAARRLQRNDFHEDHAIRSLLPLDLGLRYDEVVQGYPWMPEF